MLLSAVKYKILQILVLFGYFGGHFELTDTQYCTMANFLPCVIRGYYVVYLDKISISYDQNGTQNHDFTKKYQMFAIFSL